MTKQLKLYYSFSLIFTLMGLISVAQTTSVPDENFRQCLMENVPDYMTADGEIRSDLSVDYRGDINCSNRNIKDLTGLEEFPNISVLIVINNEIETLPDMSSFDELTGLWLGINQLSALPDFSTMTKLQVISFYKNNISTLPDLSNNNQVTYIDGSGNKLSEIPAINNLTSLTELRLQENILDTLPDLSGLTNLTTLLLYRNRLTSLPDLADLVNLETLSFFTNEIDSIPDISGLTKLKVFTGGDNNISSLPDLSANTELTTLMFWSNNLSEIQDLSHLTNLEILDLNTNQISFVPGLDKLVNLRVLKLAVNDFDSLPDLSALNKLETFNIASNKIKNHPSFHPMIRLDDYQIQDNMINSLPNDLAFLSLAQTLNIEYNLLSFEDVYPLYQDIPASKIINTEQYPLPIEDTFTFIESQNAELDIHIDSSLSSISYTWYKGDSLVSETIEPVLMLNNVDFETEGSYRVELVDQSGLIPDLTLMTNTFFVDVDTCVANFHQALEVTDLTCHTRGRLEVNKERLNFALNTGNQEYVLRNLASGEESFSTSGTFDWLPSGDYYLTADYGNGCVRNRTLTIREAAGNCKSNVITPNNDGVDDEVFFKDAGEIRIFNSSGELVKSLSGPASWDGTGTSGQIAPGYYLVRTGSGVRYVTVIY